MPDRWSRWRLVPAAAVVYKVTTFPVPGNIRLIVYREKKQKAEDSNTTTTLRDGEIVLTTE